jgi:drug/metabolite transporter (DMT)-like permease
MPSKFSHRMLPALSLLVAATMWGLFWYPLRILEAHGLPGIWTSLVAYIAALVLGLAYIWRRRSEMIRSPRMFLALALAAGWTNVSFIVAVLEGTVVRVVLLFFLSPFWTVVLGRIFLRERIGLASTLVLILAMAGALLMLWVPAVGRPWPQEVADWLAISSGFAFSVTNVLVRALQNTAVSTKTVVSWFGGVAVPLIWILVAGDHIPQASAAAWLGAVGVGVFGIILMTLTVQFGVTYMPLHRSAVILLFELVVASISALLLTNETLTAREWFGGALIVAAALLSARAQGEEH